MIDWRDLRVQYENGVPVSGEIVFSHVDDRTGEVRHFATERIQRDINAGLLRPKEILADINPVFALAAVTIRGVERHRLDRVTAQDICNYPIMMAHIPGVGRDDPAREHLMIDGTHRYVKASFLGWKSIRAYELEPEMWEPYLVNVPEIDDFTREQMAAQARGVPIDSRIR